MVFAFICRLMGCEVMAVPAHERCQYLKNVSAAAAYGTTVAQKRNYTVFIPFNVDRGLA
jgi:hypothetical protein